MKPKHAFQILLTAGLFELLLFMVLSQSSPVLLWQSLQDFVIGNAYELWPFLHGMLGIFLVLMSLSYLVFSKRGEEQEPVKDLFQPSILSEIDYGKEEAEINTQLDLQSKELKEEKEILPEEDIAKKEKKDLDIKPPLPPTKKDHSPMLDSPPPGAPKRRPPDSNRKLL